METKEKKSIEMLKLGANKISIIPKRSNNFDNILSKTLTLLYTLHSDKLKAGLGINYLGSQAQPINGVLCISVFNQQSVVVLLQREETESKPKVRGQGEKKREAKA